MIQRIQTIYLLLIACLMIVLLFVPVSNNISYSWVLSLNAGIVALLSGITIFLYKQRKLQIKLCNVILGLLVLFYVFIFVFNLDLPLNVSIRDLGFSYTALFPFIAIIFDFLAIRGIKKDEKLVRSMDRLR